MQSPRTSPGDRRKPRTPWSYGFLPINSEISPPTPTHCYNDFQSL
ncbi:MAG TPA: hypothetical protein V6D27_01790 [Vampirovibrionales bacterium]